MVLARRIALIPRRRFGTGPGTFTNQGIKVFLSSKCFCLSKTFLELCYPRATGWRYQCVQGMDRDLPSSSPMAPTIQRVLVEVGPRYMPFHKYRIIKYHSSLLRHVLLDRMVSQVQPPLEAKEPRRVCQWRVNSRRSLLVRLFCLTELIYWTET